MKLKIVFSVSTEEVWDIFRASIQYRFYMQNHRNFIPELVWISKNLSIDLDGLWIELKMDISV